MSIEDKVLSNLRKVYDPELGRSIVDLNMVKKIKYLENGKVIIEMTLTTPFCPLTYVILAMVKNAAEQVEGVKEAEVRIIGYEMPQL